MKKYIMRKLRNTLLGFALGIIIAPLAVVLSPFVMAWFCYNETEGGLIHDVSTR